MKLDRITLQGFKSFGNRTTVTFAAGITVIVGPNGSGKSNIIDALRWATGGGRASQYRADDQTDLIFHGASGKRSVGHAEVELTLAAGTQQIHVQRSLTRDGTTKLRLGGRNARFLDVDEALSGSGLGRSSLAIIGQGEISSVLMADPTSLLRYITEAAGVTRLASRREQALDRLATASQHLERLRDLHDELERQVARLRTEATEASQHRELGALQLQLQFTLAHRRHETLEQELRRLTQQEATLVNQLGEASRRSAELKAQLGSQQQATRDRQEEYRQASAAAEAWQGQLRLAENQAHNARKQLDGSKNHKQQLTADLVFLATLEAPDKPAGDPAQLKTAADEQTIRLLQLRKYREALEQQNTENQQLLNRLEQEQQLQQHSHDAWNKRQTELSSARQELSTRITATARHAEQAEREAATARKKANQLEREATGLEERIDTLRSRLEQTQLEHARASAAAESSLRSARQKRQQLETRRNYALGPRNALTSNIPGVLGPVADLISSEPAQRLALSAALGRRSEFVVTDTTVTARLVLSHVRTTGGFITLLPLDLISAPAARLNPAVRTQPGVIGLTTEHASFEPRFAALFNQLLGGTTLIDSMDAALKLSNLKNRPRLVTLEGELLETYGALSGGSRQTQATLIGQAADADAAEAAAESQQQDAQQAEARLLELQQKTRNELSRQQELRQQLASATQHAAASHEATATQQLLDELERQHRDLSRQFAALKRPPAPAGSDELSAASRAATKLKAQLVTARTREEDARRASETARQDAMILQEQLRTHAQASARYAADLQRRDELRARLKTEQEAHTRSSEQFQTAQQQLEQTTRLEPAALDTVRTAAAHASRLLSELGQQLDGATQAAGQHTQELERVRLAAARREAQLELAAEALSGFPPGISLLELSERSSRNRLDGVARQLETLGPVNHRAAAELEEEAGRAAQLAADLHDAEQASNELESTLAQVEQEVNSRTETAISLIGNAFQRHVQELFGESAQAGIAIERSEGRPSGLSISLQPPGKRTRQLNLLSVGERTMGALAFLFALLDGSGEHSLPIAVLDEVDAPLDEANIVRFASFIKRLAERGTQFILVSHQKTTFEAAEVMWGVTSDQGVSKLFSISRDQPERAAPAG